MVCIAHTSEIGLTNLVNTVYAHRRKLSGTIAIFFPISIHIYHFICQGVPNYKLDTLLHNCYHVLAMCNHLREADMVRTQIQLPEEQVAILKEMAATEHKSMAEIIRQSVDFFAKAKYGGGEEQRRRRAMAAAGQFRSGVKDLAASHDSYLTEAFGE
jgi:hypothetical protein